MILVPVKNLNRAKQRLAPLLDQPARTALAHAMLRDVLEALAGNDVCLVTSDPFALELAAEYRLTVIRDDRNTSETDAIEMATARCASRALESTLVIPGDIPLIEPADIQAIFHSAPARGCVLVPSAEKRGTNAVLRRPAALFPLRFGNDSFWPHLAAAIAAEQACVVLSLPRIALDIDTPDDLRQLALAPGEKRSQQIARNLGTFELPAAVNS
jgi:2-phospho-L-lactate guanylyltransferase